MTNFFKEHKLRNIFLNIFCIKEKVVEDLFGEINRQCPYIRIGIEDRLKLCSAAAGVGSSPTRGTNKYKKVYLRLKNLEKLFIITLLLCKNHI